MKPLQLAAGQPTVVRHNTWVKMEDGSFRCGDVIIRNDGDTGIRSDWRIYRVDENGKLTRVWAKSRPWGYGHSGQAKIGASRINEPQEAEVIKDDFSSVVP